MKIKDRIALQFTLMVAVILLLFSIAVYSVSARYRQEEFYDRLKSKAQTTCRLLVKVKGIDNALSRVKKKSRAILAEYEEKNDDEDDQKRFKAVDNAISRVKKKGREIAEDIDD